MLWTLRALWLVFAHDLSEYKYMDDVTETWFLSCSTGIHTWIDQVFVNRDTVKIPWRQTVTKTSFEKWIQISLYRDYSNSLTFSNASELFWSWISMNHSQVHKEKEI